MPENVSPEQRLFEVIQDTKKPGAAHQAQLEKIKSGIFGLRRFFGGGKDGYPATVIASHKGAKQSSFSDSPKGIFSFHLKLGELKLEAVNKTLSIILAVAVSSVAYYAIASKAHYYKMERSLLGAQFRPARNKAPIEVLKTLATYIARANKRDIFSPAPKAEAGKVDNSAEQALEQLRQAAAELKLEGISYGDEPKAMIMNTKENKMYFLSEGQPIGATGLEVRKIVKDKVVIGSGTEEMDLL